MAQSKKSSKAKAFSAPKSGRRSASTARRASRSSSSSKNLVALRQGRKWMAMIKHTHIADLASTPPPPFATDEGSVSVNPLPAIDEYGLRHLRTLYQDAFGFEQIEFKISDDNCPSFIYSEGGEDGRARIVVEVENSRNALFIKDLLNFAAYLAGTSMEFTR